MIPSSFIFFGLTIYTQSLFLILAVVIATFVIWHESKKEGFDEDSIFDMVIFVLICGVFAGRVAFALSSFQNVQQMASHVVRFWIPGTDFLSLMLGGIAGGYIWAKFKRWSVNRLSDIFALGVSISLPVFLSSYFLLYEKFEYILAFGLTLLIFVFSYWVRQKQFIFGGLFGLSLMLNASVLLLFSRGGKSLIIWSVLFTLGVVVLVTRFIKSRMKFTNPLSKDFLNQIAGLLSKKEKELAKEESLLEKEDMEKVASRGSMSAEEADGVMEDEQHAQTDLLKQTVIETRRQIRKALAMLKIGSYGVCEICHRPIDPARLKAFPEATTCLDCEEKKRK